MRNHYMNDYTHCMTRMMEATPDCHQPNMRNMYQANWELMHMFMEDQCQMNQDGKSNFNDYTHCMSRMMEASPECRPAA